MVIDKKDFLVRNNEIQSIIGSACKIREETGWIPALSMDDTLASMLLPV
jgi:hypothetical protein